jgi:hypothetical protein
MKTQFLRPALALAMFMIMGCSSDSDSEPTCPQGFTGSDCMTKITPSKIMINKVVIRAFPNLTPPGALWDTNEDTSEDWPDLMFIIKQGNTPIYITPSSSIAVDVQPSQQVTFNISPALEITEPLDAYGIELADYDGSLESSDLMVNYFFGIYDPTTNSFPDHVTITDAAQLFQADFYMTYAW